MKANKPGKSRHKLSFAVDRADIDISSDWVQAVMNPAPPQENTATVENNATVANNTTVAVATTVEKNSTVARFDSYNSATVEENATVALFVGEQATPARSRQTRLRPIRQVADGLTPGQLAVYTLMLGQGSAQDPGQGRVHYRGGYFELSRGTGLSKRGVQNVIGELQDKRAITVHNAPGHHKTQPTVYEVRNEESLLVEWKALGWRYAMGKSKQLINIATVAG